MISYRPQLREARPVVSTLPGRAAALVALLHWAVAGCKAQEVAPAPEVPVPATHAPEEPAPNAAVPAAPAAAGTAPAPAVGSSEPSTPSIHAFTMTKLDGTPKSLGAWTGKVVLVVNTASKCGYTPQYEGLQQLHAKYSPRGFAVLGFPSNDFGGQEPGTSREIASFCTSIYAVNFPMFEKIKVTGQERSPLFALLSDARGAPKWNFHKYLVDKHGRPVQAWPSAVTPGSPEIASAIEAQLAAQ
ncbi:MAG: glutathione peroxidase [Deltaproteobacteria bacterium]